MEFHIAKFHVAVSKGPLYICSCCDQLWYKHRVVHADTFKKGKPETGKHLGGKVSFDGIEWLCKSCKKFLSKNKIPACAVVNGMVFLQKPSFFDLNELECRLLAPRIAFKNLCKHQGENSSKSMVILLSGSPAKSGLVNFRSEKS